MKCRTCQEEGTVHVRAIGLSFCEACLKKIDNRIAEINSNPNYANILEALGSIVETRCYLQKMRRLSEEGPLPDWTAVMENLQGALRESEVVLVRVQRLYNAANEPR